ncbi:MAG: ABC transporter ATP-binding protein [candidate division Zixibacteria bacterium]|nr:ABC transporter ATP-binding protein [candidate division Zixibacteria bacterium]MDH3938235.1 ABC transporter ATP-binding protein [candidate division Zixibacteria bacterium]MDH4033292.1 ABC transporter ATP-binding protein [candidate division Zixibacteria bacterium]
MTNDGRAIAIENLSFSYGDRLVLDRVDLTVSSNEFCWIVGPNGGGKTTLLKLILGLLAPSVGKVQLFGQAPKTVRERIGYMPQHVSLDQRFPVTVMDVVLMGRLGGKGWRGRHGRADQRAAERAIEQVGLSEQSQLLFSELSGGQQRRMFIARALVCQPDLLILDEPTANIDQVLQREFYKLLERLRGSLTVVMVSHDPAFVSRFVKHVVCVNRTVEIHPTGEVSAEKMGEWYRGRDLRIVRHDRHYEVGD